MDSMIVEMDVALESMKDKVRKDCHVFTKSWFQLDGM